MSKSSLKLKHFEVINLNVYFQQMYEDIMQEEEDIVDIIYEASDDSKFTFTFLLLLSKGSLIYLEYNTTNKKLTKIFKNSVLSSIVSNDIECCELSYTSPILLSTCLNEIILIDTKQKPCQLINITEENIVIYSAYTESSILDIKFNCNQSSILVITQNQLLIYKLTYDKYEQKNILQLFSEIKLYGLPSEIDYTNLINYRIFPKFSDLNDNILYISYITEEKVVDKHTKISLEQEENLESFFYLNIAKITLNKKDVTVKIIVIYIVNFLEKFLS